MVPLKRIKRVIALDVITLSYSTSAYTRTYNQKNALNSLKPYRFFIKIVL